MKGPLNGRSNNGNCDSAETGNCNETEKPLRIEQGKKLVEHNRRKKEELKRLNEQITKQDGTEHKPKPDMNTYVYVGSLSVFGLAIGGYLQYSKLKKARAKLNRCSTSINRYLC